jgi:hypothetical protein
MCLWPAEWRKNGRVRVNAFLPWKKITVARDLFGIEPFLPSIHFLLV